MSRRGSREGGQAVGHDDRGTGARRCVELAHASGHVPAHEGTRGEGDIHAVRTQACRLPVIFPCQEVGRDGQGLCGCALVEDGQHSLGEVAAVDAVPGLGQGDGECARRAAHIQDLVALREREEVHEPALVLAGREPGERRGPLVPISLRVSVDCAVVCRHEMALHCASIACPYRGHVCIMTCKRRFLHGNREF